MANLRQLHSSKAMKADADAVISFALYHDSYTPLVQCCCAVVLFIYLISYICYEVHIIDIVLSLFMDYWCTFYKIFNCTCIK